MDEGRRMGWERGWREEGGKEKGEGERVGVKIKGWKGKVKYMISIKKNSKENLVKIFDFWGPENFHQN